MKLKLNKQIVLSFILLISFQVFSQSTNNQNCFISILDFGAKMDGVFDDSDAIMSSLNKMGYAYIPSSEIGARIDKQIILRGNQNLMGQSRSSVLKSFVPSGQFAIRVENVEFVESVFIKDLTLDIQSKDSNGIQAFETRNVYIDNIAIVGNRKCNIGIQLNGGKEKGTAWNQILRYTITRCKLGIELTSNTVNNFCNRNYIGFGVIQSCEVGVRLHRASTNTILACPQGCPIGMELEGARLNTIDTYIENAETSSIKLDAKSNFNTISGQIKLKKLENKGKNNMLNINRPENLKKLN